MGPAWPFSFRILLSEKARWLPRALETLLIDKKIISKFCKPILDSLLKNGCKLIGDKNIIKYYKGKILLAKENDWNKEYLAPIISIKSVNGVEEAINHINKYGKIFK